jgi:hypothetical protein
VVAGQRLGGMAEESDLVAGVERVPRVVVHHLLAGTWRPNASAMARKWRGPAPQQMPI